MKTPLPEKYTKLDLQAFHGNDSIGVAIKVHQLIDYLAELTTVVEGKPRNLAYTTMQMGENGKPRLIEVERGTPPLKQTLINELEKAVEYDTDDLPYFRPSDVEAIINRLMP